MPSNSRVKMVAVFRRKPSLSMEEFIDYYENRHVPMILEILTPFVIDYRRSFVLRDAPPIAGPAPEFDVITEAWFATQQQFERFAAQAAEYRDKIQQDEANFVDPSSLRMFLVKESVSTRLGSGVGAG